jgi:hypothetical protein
VAPNQYAVKWPATHFNNTHLSSTTLTNKHTQTNNHTRTKPPYDPPHPSKVTKRSIFHVGTKIFTLSFAGGRVAPYQIKEHRGKFHGSLWLNMVGLKWLLDVIEQVKVKADKSGFFQFLHSSYNILEVSCLKNKGGRYLEIAKYHSREQKGSIRIPEGSRATGWQKLVDEIGSFFLGREARNKALVVIPAGGAADKGGIAVNGHSGSSGSSRDSRALGNLVAPSTQTEDLKNSCRVSNSNSRALMNPDAPRPTRKTHFTWNPSSNSLRVTKNKGEARKAHWVSLKYKAVGLVQPKFGPQAQAQPDNSIILDPGSVEPTLNTSQVNACTVVGETSRLSDSRLDSSDEAPRRSLEDSEPSIVPSVALEVTIFNNPGADMEEGEIHGDSYSDEDDASDLDVEEVRVDLADSATELDLPLTVESPLFTIFDEAMQMIEASGAVDEENMLSVVNYCEAGECSSPLSCSPLAMINPTEPPTSVAILGVGANASQEVFSQWVKKHYRGFYKLVGFPLDSHEEQCMALLQSIEAERMKYKSSGKMKQSGVSVRKGARELRNLASSINYDGRLVGC